MADESGPAIGDYAGGQIGVVIIPPLPRPPGTTNRQWIKRLLEFIRDTINATGPIIPPIVINDGE
jgi:hypothetical protein